MFSFFGAKKRTKRNIHPNQTFPYMGRLKQKIAETDDFFYVLVSRDDAMSYLFDVFNVEFRHDSEKLKRA